VAEVGKTPFRRFDDHAADSLVVRSEDPALLFVGSNG
jgi:hypothetical protein